MLFFYGADHPVDSRCDFFFGKSARTLSKGQANRDTFSIDFNTFPLVDVKYL